MTYGQQPPFGGPGQGRPAAYDPTGHDNPPPSPYGPPPAGSAPAHAGNGPAHAGYAAAPPRSGEPQPAYGAAQHGYPAPAGAQGAGHAPHGQEAAWPYPEAPARPGTASARRRRPPLPTGGAVTDEDERWSVPAYVGMFVVGFAAPAVAYVAKGRSSRFVRFHSAQALNLSIALSVCGAAALLLTSLIGALGLLILLGVVATGCLCVVKAAIGANRCEWYRLPPFVAWPIVR